FNSRITDLVIRNHEAKGVVLRDGSIVGGIAVILATGHSSRDIYRMLHEKGILLEAKPFAVGVRVEHPQELIDRIQYHGTKRGDYLPAATYSFVEQVHDRGVYSFCMCPGGLVVPAATAPGELVVNGMSPSDRGGLFANSGLVVEIRPGDLPVNKNILGMFLGLQFQEDIEKLCFAMAGNTQLAPAQRLADFVSGRKSLNLPQSSYRPGLVESPLHDWLPRLIGSGLQEGIKLIGRKTKGYLTNEAIVIGVESRTSSPVRIPRDPETLEHVQIKRLFPCGEGSGYAGGIMSSAVDGERVAEMIANLCK
ncbi:MAG: FAD-binding protein, partial [Bacteroidia bacterium]|nr:FAD-binding protein [Bacteroidia bacterium]